MAANFSTGPSGAPTTADFDMANVDAFLRHLRGSDAEENPDNSTERSATLINLTDNIDPTLNSIEGSDPNSSQLANPVKTGLPARKKAGSKRNKPPKPPTTKGKTQNNVRWNDLMVEPLMNTLRQHALEGKAAEGGFKAVTWNACVAAVKPHYKGSGGLTAKCCRNKFAHYKRIWRIWKAHCRSVSGWGRNDEGVPVNESDVEDNYFGDHADRAIFRDTLPPYHDHLIDIVGESVATGAHVHEAQSDTADDAEGSDDEDETEARNRRESTSVMTSPEASTPPRPQTQSSNPSNSLIRQATKRATERATENNSKKMRVADRFADRLQEISTESTSRLERTVQNALGAAGTPGQGKSVLEQAMAILKTDFKDRFSMEDRLDIMSSFREESNARILVNMEPEERLFWLLRLLQEKK
jgi:hypothetical protein